MKATIIGLILAGGRSQRMGGREKAFLPLDGETLLRRAMTRLAPQCADMVLNANGDPARFETFGLPVIADTVDGHAGPLAGLLAGLDWITAHAPEAALLTVPVDGPFFPDDLAARLRSAATAEGADIACATSNGRRHGVYGLWSPTLRDGLRRDLVERGTRRVEDWLATHQVALVDWPTRPHDPFLNINTPEDLAAAERLVARPATLDLRGLKCPLPALRTRKALATLTTGDVITVECTDPLAAIDIPHLVAQCGDVIEDQSRQGDTLMFRIRKGGR